MRALRWCLLPVCFAGLFALDAPRDLIVPGKGTPEERVAALWSQTRSMVLADAAEPLTDQQSVERGGPLIRAWTLLDTDIADTDAGGASGAVLKLLHDFYGRPESTPERRVAIRKQVRSDFARRLALVDDRVKG